MTSSNSDRQMATMEIEHYWRLYLFLNEGVSFLSRGIILRKLDVLGKDLSSLLRENEKQIKKNDNLDSSDLDILFPVDGETNMDKWNPNMYLCVILELFQKSLDTKERTKLKAVQQVLKDLCKRQDDTKINVQTYEEHIYNLEEAFLVLTFNEDSTMKIVEIKKIYINEPLNSDSLQNGMAKMEFPSNTKQNLINFLGAIYEGCNENQSETFKNTENSVPGVTNPQEHRNVEKTSDEKDRMKQDNDSRCTFSDKTHEDIEQDTDLNDKQTEDSVVNNSIKDNNAEVGSDGIGACATNEDIENSSDGIGAVVIAADVENEIVSNANKPQTDEETKCIARELDMTRFEKSLRKKDLETFISEEVNSWAKQQVNIAVIGRSGVGKSRLINAIRGCKEGDPEYAKIDVTEATMSVQKYPDPNNSLLTYWDLPGIGTDTFPRNKYTKMKEINFDSYDIYLIVSADRFMEDEGYLAKTIEESGKTFLFVRTKADMNEEEFPDFKSVLERMRKNCVENLSSRKIQAKDVYLISSKFVDHKLLDFGRLFERLVVSLPDLKKEALLNSCCFNTRALIKEKRTQLIKRAKKASAASAAAGAVPIPGFSFCVDSKLILHELDEYRHILFITERDFENLAMKTGIAVNELKKKYKFKSITFLTDTTIGATKFLTFVPLFKKIALSELAENTAKLIPVIGATVGMGISCYTTYKFLTSMIEILVQDAEKMLDVLLEKTGSSILQSN